MKPAVFSSSPTLTETPGGGLFRPADGELSASQLLPLFMADLQTLKTENLARWFDEESELWLPPCEPARGTRRILTLFGLIFRRYQTLSWEISAVYSAGERKLVYQTESNGTFADGHPYANSILTIIEFSPGGKIRFLSDYFKDTATFGRPLAASPAGPKPASGR
ncbi:MAG TPA: nuclear transport factor 2 family protein [candidate division Zixibacteria bacterium]|nr:nuclear transport factor 2 family protein [candidate division Zixibacteria bacterium]